MALVTFLVSSGATQVDACSIGPYFIIYFNDAPNQCDPCLPINCFPCVNTTDQFYLDPALTQLVPDGYYSNELQPGVYATWYVIGGFPQPAGFGSCPIAPTPTPTLPTNPTPTPTPSVTSTPTGTPNVTPSNTPTISLTPSVSASALPQLSINFKTIADDFKYLANSHKQINSFGIGDTDQLGYLIQSRDRQENESDNSPYYPLLYVVPSNIKNELRFKTWTFNVVSLDIVERDLGNTLDTLSDTLQILNDVISQFRLSVTDSQGNFNELYYLDDTVQCNPFQEKYQDLCNGWSGLLQIKTRTPLDRCAAAFRTFTGTPIYHKGINLKTFIDDFQLLADHHKQINSFGWGDFNDFSYNVDSRDKQSNPTYNAPYYPYMFVIPNNATQEFGFMTYEFNIIIADLVDRDLNNMIDGWSDTNQILDDIISQFRLSVTDSLGNFNQDYYLDDMVDCSPFIEKYDDMLIGWTGTLRIQVKTPLDRCDAPFDEMAPPDPTQNPTPTPTRTPTQTPTYTPTPTSTIGPTPTTTTTLTPSPTETPTTTPTLTASPTETMTPTPSETPTQTPTITASPTETITPTPSETPTQTPTPTITDTPTSTPTPTLTASQTPTITSSPTQTPTPSSTPCVCDSYTIEDYGFGSNWVWINCNGTSSGATVTNTTLTFCACSGSVTQTGGGFAGLVFNGSCFITPTPTPTQTNTPTLTASPTNTPSVTTTQTPTPSSPSSPVWNTNNSKWDNETKDWNF